MSTLNANGSSGVKDGCSSDVKDKEDQGSSGVQDEVKEEGSSGSSDADSDFTSRLAFWKTKTVRELQQILASKYGATCTGPKDALVHRICALERCTGAPGTLSLARALSLRWRMRWSILGQSECDTHGDCLMMQGHVPLDCRLSH